MDAAPKSHTAGQITSLFVGVLSVVILTKREVRHEHLPPRSSWKLAAQGLSSELILQNIEIQARIEQPITDQ